MPDLSLKLPNFTAEMSWSWRIRDSIDGGVCDCGEDDDILVNVCVIAECLWRLGSVVRSSSLVLLVVALVLGFSVFDQVQSVSTM